MNEQKVPDEKHGPWTVLARRVVYEDPWMSVRRDEVKRPDGSPGSYSTVRIKRGVCVIPMDENRDLFLTKEFHYAVGRDTIEGISGGIETEETEVQAAERELLEEVGIRARKLTPIGKVDPLTAALWSPTQLYWATELTHTQAAPEATELIDVVKIPLDHAVRAVLSGEISHAPTCVAILKIHTFLTFPAMEKEFCGLPVTLTR